MCLQLTVRRNPCCFCITCPEKWFLDRRSFAPPCWRSAGYELRLTLEDGSLVALSSAILSSGAGGCWGSHSSVHESISSAHQGRSGATRQGLVLYLAFLAFLASSPPPYKLNFSYSSVCTYFSAAAWCFCSRSSASWDKSASNCRRSSAFMT
jgi:hypothetical protein